jgi:hypothetical protein
MNRPLYQEHDNYWQAQLTFLPATIFDYFALEFENIFSDSTVLLTLQEPLTYIDHVSDFWNKVGAPISFVSGILAGSIPWLFTKIRNIRKK